MIFYVSRVSRKLGFLLVIEWVYINDKESVLYKRYL